MDYMKEAYRLAEKGLYTTYPNPMVGAVIVYKDQIIGSGYHEKYGSNHAERNAVKDTYDRGNGHLIKDSAMYVTLEPCNHQGKTPPCLDLILKEKIKNVHISQLDVNPIMSGKSVEILKNNGVNVTSGYMSEYGEKLNSKFMNQFIGKKPYVTLKTAITLDGKIASKNYDSKWITCEESRKMVHLLRSNNHGILTSYKTLNIDNARLNIRHIESLNHPVPIILDADLKTNRELDIFDIHEEIIIVTSKSNEASDKKIDFRGEGSKAKIKYLYVDLIGDNRKLDLEGALIELKKLGIHSIMAECGGSINWELLSLNLVDEYWGFIAPKILGGRDSISCVSGEGFDKISESINLEFIGMDKIGTDILIRGRCICSQE